MPSVVYNAKSVAPAASGAHLYPTTISASVKMLKYQHIAPAPPATGLTPGAADDKARKYIMAGATIAAAGPTHYGVDQTHSVQRRNARERNRVKQVNNSFANLRQHIPQTIIADLTKGGGRGPHKKISKVDTLRIAVEYIRRLQDLVDDLNSNCGSSDSASNSSFCSSPSSHAGSPPPPAQLIQASSSLAVAATVAEASTSAHLYFAHASSPTLPSFQFTQQQQQNHHHHQQQQQQQQQLTFPSALLTPVSLNSYSPPPSRAQLEAAAGGCQSPTSSFNSSMSFDSGNFEAPQQLSPQQAHLQLKYEPYDSFKLDEEDRSPDDEEILDYISLWQDQ